MRKFVMIGLAVVLLTASASAVSARGTSKAKASASVHVSVNNSSISIFSHDDDDDISVFRAKLRGSEEVPAVTTKSKGQMTLWHDERHDRIPFTLTVMKGNDVTMAHLHCAVVGSNGPVVVTLLGEIPGGFDINGRLMKSNIEDDNINTMNGATCPTAINDVDSLVTAMKKKEIYVNVHTMDHPSGEIRGQVKEIGN